MNGRRPPHNLEAEQGALGCVMLESALVAQLEHDHFYDNRHQAIFGLLSKLYQGGKPTDILSLVAFVNGEGGVERFGGLEYLNSLPDKTPSVEVFNYFLEQLQEDRVRRKQIGVGSTLVENGYNRENDVWEVQDQAESSILAIRSASLLQPRTNAQLLEVLQTDLDEAVRNPDRLRGLSTGIPKLDEHLWGMKPGQLIVIGARPSEGKTALALNVALDVARSVPVGVISLEMSVSELMARALSIRSQISGTLLRSGNLSDQERLTIGKAMVELGRTPIRFVDQDCATLSKIKPMAIRMVREDQIGLLAIDYLQLIKSSNPRSSLYEAMTDVSNSLKRLARDLGIPILVGAQLNREVAKENRRPKMFDLKDTGAIEQDADVVILIHNDNEKERDYRVPSELLVAKNRGGPTGMVHAIFDKPISTFKASEAA